MLAINIKADRIDYEKTLVNLYPAIKERLAAAESQNMIIRLFQKLDDAALPVLLSFMGNLSETAKNQLVAQCLKVCSKKLGDILNRELGKHPFGKCLRVGEVSGVCGNDGISLWFSRVYVDYKGLVKEKLGDKIGGIASFLVSDKMEKMALEFLWTDKRKRKIIDFAKNALNQHGFVVELVDIQIRLDMEDVDVSIETTESFELPDEVEDEILDALAAFLRKYV